MNTDQVKAKLLELYDCRTEFKVFFSGKKSKKVNGLYKYLGNEIVIHDKNFQDDNGDQNEMLLMFTAIHELSHHVLVAERGNKSSRAHSQEFWATFHNLLDIAKKRGIYKANIDGGTKKLIEEARDISRQIAELQRKLGSVLLAINDSCRTNGLRYEDIVEREAQIDKKTADIAITSHKMGDLDVGADIQAEAARQHNEEKRAAIIEAGQEGKSVVQAKEAAVPMRPARPIDQEDKTAALLREEEHIKATIDSLTHRLEIIAQQLVELGEREDGKHGASAA